MEIKDILKPREYDSLNQINQTDRDWLNGRIHARRDGEPGVECVVRGKNSDGDYFKLTPEEIIRQYYAYKLISEYGYRKEQLSFEEPVFFAGRQSINDKRIDIAVFDEQHRNIILLIEVKRPEIINYKVTCEGESTTPYQQMQSYANQKHPSVGVLVNGVTPPEFYDYPNYENQLVIDRFPQANENIQEWKEKRRFTLKQLMQSDRLKCETLKDIVLEVEQKFGANDSSDKAFEEIFKLIFTKLYDEKMSSDDADIIANDTNRHHISLKDVDDSDFRVLEFRVIESNTLDEVYNKINNLFLRAQQQWKGVFPANSKLNMQKATVKSCVKELQNVKLFNSNLEVVDDAFEHLVNQNQKEEMGQYFTPRYVIDMCVKMLNPKPDEKMIDTAAGSCGFPMHTIFHVWKQMNPEAYNLFTTRRRSPEETEYVQNNVFGIDFSEKSVRVGRMLNIIAGDGHTNIIELNSLDYKNWDSDYVAQQEWRGKYEEGFRKLVAMSADMTASLAEKKYKGFSFDVLMANPPFAGDLDNKEQIEQYDLGHKDGQVSEPLQKKIGRDILFIERNLNFLKPGGRMAIVLPQGRFNNSTDKYIREYIMERCRLLAVVGLHVNVFKPHTQTKTSVLLVQKWTDENCGFPNICPRPEANEDGKIDYPIFFATMQEPSKDNSGNKIYVSENYVTWSSYSYKTVKTIVRKSDNSVLSEEEYNKFINKDNYQKDIKEVLYIKKSDGSIASEEEYTQNKSDYKKKTVYEYKRISDGNIVSEDEYKELTKKSAYKIIVETLKEVEEHKNEDGTTRYIKDLFVKEHGPIDEHRKWIQEKVKFNKKGNEGNHPESLTIDEWLQLSSDDRKLYKKEFVIGDNDNPVISKEQYEALPDEAKKFYVLAEDVVESVERIKDTHGHIFVKHDLFNHDPLLENCNPNNIYSQDGIAEAFIEFAKKEHLSFF